MIAAHHPTHDRGETSIQSVVLVPVVFLIAFMCFHVGSLLHQSHIAHVAAAMGAEVASSANGSKEIYVVTRHEVERVVRDLNSHLVRKPSISVEPEGVRVSVSVQASSAISFLPQSATASVWKPWETFRREQDRR